MEKDALEQFIEDKLNEQEFTYQPAYWDQAAAQMAVWEAEARRKRRFLWFYLFSGIIFISLAISGISALAPRATLASAPLYEWDGSIGMISPLLTQTAMMSPPSENASSLSSPAAVSISTSFSNPTKGLEPSPQPSQTNRSVPTARPKAISTNSDSKLLLSIKKERSAKRPPSYKLQSIGARNFKLASFFSSRSPQKEALRRQRLSSLNFYLQSGTNLSTSEMGESGSSLRGGNSMIGLGIRYNLRPGLALESGLQYHGQQIDNLSLSLSGREFDFVAREQSIRWELQQLHWLSLPLQISLRPLKRHELSLGMSLDYLLGTQGRVFKSSRDPFNPLRTQEESGNGIVYGLRSLDYSAQIAYR
ncbi:MAG: hypothetical protein AAGM67_17255, partial [Bacteroidota bacterium]